MVIDRVLCSRFTRKQYLKNPWTLHHFITSPSEETRTRNSSQSTNSIYHVYPLPPIHPIHIANMPKGGSRRDDHHCSQRYLGGCRWVNKPVRHCATHSNRCPIHDMPHQTYQRCRMCEGEQDAAERAFRKQQVSNNSPSNDQGKKGQGKRKR
jgi:hypothetical protein